MKNSDLFARTALTLLLFGPLPLIDQNAQAIAFVTESEKELVSTGDFNGDGREDVVITDKDSGKYRLGYQMDNGLFNWVSFRPSGMKYVSWLSVGKLVASDHDALAFASADGNQVSVADPKDAGTPTPPMTVPFSALGPNSVVAIDVGGAGNTPLHDLFLASMYNSDPAPSRITLMRSTGAQFNQLDEAPAPGTLSHANRVSFKAGGPEYVATLVTNDKGDALQVEDVSSGKAVIVASAGDVASGSDFLLGNFRGAQQQDFLVFKSGESNVTLRPVLEPGAGKVQIEAGQKFDVGKPVRQAYAVPSGNRTKLLFIFGEGESAALYDFDGTKAPVLSQTVTNRPGDLFMTAAVLSNGFVVLSTPPKGRYSSQYHIYTADSGKFTAKAYGSLPTLDDTDDITVPDIYKKITTALDVADESQMKPYTNAIPGTSVTYVMMPIPGGEFVMGTPENETGHKPDEGPQHPVKIAPFWMAKFEITWNEYELFMYPEDEKKLAKVTSGETYVDKLADAVTRPSKPYVEMSFGMGKYGYPAISMTQHAANKYCHWLSAKTGHFYRLPTEAEWEYACRAGTKTAYFFGNDDSKLEDYAWFAKNSDFKYQKVGKKKPNPWGLCDMYGNVVEWCLDQYDPNYYKQFANTIADNPWNRATKPYPHSVRGGSWDDDDSALLRSGARRGSDRAWKAQDPQLPKSIWYHSDAQFVGFRLVRPLKVPPPAELGKYWTSGVERD